eukprot:s679_g15.t1
MQITRSIAPTLSQQDTNATSTGQTQASLRSHQAPSQQQPLMPPPPQAPSGSQGIALPLPGEAAQSPHQDVATTRSWQRVEIQLTSNQTNQPIAQAIETALIDLLDASQTATDLDAWGDGLPIIPPGQSSPADPSRDYLPATERARDFNSIAQEAAVITRYLTSLGYGQLSEHRRPITYNIVELHIAARLRWLGTLSSDIEVHLQLPSALTSLWEILNSILDQTMSPAIWATMIEVGEALEHLVRGRRLVFSSDTLSLQAGGHDPARVEQAIGQARGNRFVETLGAMRRLWPSCQLSLYQWHQKQR